jgi:signal transduction histidine kinase
MIARLPIRLVAPFARPETYRALLFYLTGAALGTLGFAVLIAGWSVTLCLAITPLVFPLLFGFRWAVGQLARAQALVANGLLGTRLNPPTRTTRGNSFWSRSLNVVGDGAFWRQQAHLLLTWPTALIPIALLSASLQLLTLPVWYRWVNSADVFGFANVDTFAETLPLFAIGLGLLVLEAHVLGWSARLSRGLARHLLRGDATGPMRTPAEVNAVRRRALEIYAVVVAGISVLLIAIWALTTRDYFWPIHAILPLALPLAIVAWIFRVLADPDIERRTLGSRALAIQVGVSGAIWGYFVIQWLVTERGYFWPAWILLALAAAAAVHAGVVFFRREYDRSHRIEELEETRAGAVDAQETELRRIERDLHDGAQARLVALGMSIGMAEEKLRTDPEGALALLAEARTGAKEALEELRDLARGIHPPILTDRGIDDAIRALAARSPIPVALELEDPGRHNAAIETAAYFVAAEALANAIKHSGADRIDIRKRRVEDTLIIEVADDGRGGADPSGGGLTGLKRRVSALDGRLRIASPAGGPTTVRAELPCE